VPAGAGLVPPAPAGPPQAEGEAGVADEAGGVLPGQACQAGGLGDGELDRGDAGRAGLAGPGGDGRVAEGMPSSALLSCSCSASSGWLLAVMVMSPHRALRIAAWRSCARAVRALWRQIASKPRAWHWSHPQMSFPALNVSSHVMLARDHVT